MVLAAGAARRFGGDKMLADWRGRPLVAWAVRSALETEAERVIVVLPAEDLRMEAALVSAFAPALREGRLALTPCADADEGMGASLRHGVGACDRGAEGVFVFLGDMPRVPPEVPAALARAIRAGALAAAPVWQGQRGHPVLFSAAVRPTLLRAAGDVGMKVLLAELGPGLATVAAPGNGVLFDVDTVEDLASGPREPS